MYVGHIAVCERIMWELALDACVSVWRPGWRLCFPSCLTRSVRSARQSLGGHHQLSGGCCWGPASHKQGSKISLERALSTCAVSVCLIKTGWKCSPELAVSDQVPPAEQHVDYRNCTGFSFCNTAFFRGVLSRVPQRVLWHSGQKNSISFLIEKWLYFSGIFVYAYQVCWEPRSLFSLLLWIWGELILLTRCCWKLLIQGLCSHKR